MNRLGVDFTFSWIFAIIAGAVILFSAIYITTQLIDSGNLERDTLVASQITNLLNPIETNLEDSKYSRIEFSGETRIHNDCSTSGAFGRQQISTSSKAGVGDDWSRQSARRSSFNKYIFSRGVEESTNRKLHVMARPLVLPYKLGDILIVHGGEYCFINPPSRIEEEFNDLSTDGATDIGVNISSSISSCPRYFTTVCFNQIGCDVNVNTQSGTVSKDGTEMHYYEDSLMLAAIFSDTEVYECQLKRFMARAGELGAVYTRKALYLEGNGCSNNLVPELGNFVLSANISGSRDLVRTVVPIAEDLKEANNGLASCKIF